MTVAFSARAHSRRNRWRREAAARSCAPACLRAHRPNRTLLVDANGPVKLARVRMKLETPGRQNATPMRWRWTYTKNGQVCKN